MNCKKKKTNIGKTILYVFLGFGIVAALVGSGLAISRSVSRKISTSDTTQSSNDNQINNGTTNGGTSSNTSGGSTTGSGDSGTTSQGGSGNTSQGGSTSSGDNNSSSENSNHSTTNQVTINCSAGEVYWYNNLNDSSSWNTLSVVCALNGLPANATNSDKALYIYCDDDDLDQWIEISTMRNGSKVVLNSPYSFTSGETITLTQKKAAPATGFYKIPLWVFATNYDTDQVYHIIDVWFRTNS